jgi:glucose-1-phosphate thymidylyltransferase
MQNKTSTLIAIIPAAGKGSRLEPFPCPKELFPVGYQDYTIKGSVQKRPKVVSQYLIENIIKAGVKKFIFIISEGKSDIMSYYGNGSRFGIHISYLYQEQINGMPAALNLAFPWTANATFVFGMPDTIIEPHDFFAKLLNYHHQTEAAVTLGLFPTNTPSKFAMTEIDENNHVTFIIDKPAKSALTHTWGCACWNSEFSGLINDYLANTKLLEKEIVLTDIFNYALEKKLKVNALKLDDARYIDIGTADELDTALKKFHL